MSAFQRRLVFNAANNPNPICVDNPRRLGLFVACPTAGTSLTIDRAISTPNEGWPISTASGSIVQFTKSVHGDFVTKAWLVNVTGIGIVVTVFEWLSDAPLISTSNEDLESLLHELSTNQVRSKTTNKNGAMWTHITQKQ